MPGILNDNHSCLQSAENAASGGLFGGHIYERSGFGLERGGHGNREDLEHMIELRFRDDERR